MRANYLFSTLSFLTIIVAKPVEIYFEASGKDVQGPVGAVLEGDGFNLFIHGAGNFGEYYHFENGIASRMMGSKRGYVGVFGPYLGAGTEVTPTKLEIKNNEITNLNFWSCKNTDDPHEFSKDYDIIAVTEQSKKTAPFKQCTSVKMKIKDESS